MVRVYGKVVDKTLKEPIARALVELTTEGYSGERYTNSGGNYEFDSYGIPPNKTYTLKVTKTGYNPFSTSFYVGLTDVEVNVELEPSGIPSDRALLEVHAYMDDKEVAADVEVKDFKVPPEIDLKGKTPFQALLPLQSYDVLCDYMGYHDEKTANLLEGGKTYRVDFYFRTIPPSKPVIDVYALYGSVEVEADVTCNGRSAKTPARFEVDPGTYTIRVTYMGREKTAQVTVTYGDYAPLFFQFASGTLECHAYADSEEVKAKTDNVYVVGVGWFKTPFTVELDIGKYVVNAHYDTQTDSKTANILLGQTTRVDFYFRKTGFGEPFLLATGLIAIATGLVVTYASQR